MKNSFFKNTSLDQPLTEYALALKALNNDKFYPSGTCIIIAPHLAITAKHVVEDYYKIFDHKRIDSKGGNLNSSFAMRAVQILNNGKESAIWEVSKIYLAPSTDIAFLYLNPFTKNAIDYKWKPPKLTLEFPEIGEKIFAFGYRNSKITIEKNILKWKSQPASSQGVVIEVHPEFRDKSRLNFPCFHTNARFDGGMSGGPVFNEKGFLCGLVCSNLPPENTTQDHVSYVSLLWASLITEIDIPYDRCKGKTTYPILTLAQNGILHLEGWEKISIEVDNNTGKSTRISYKSD